MAVRAVSPVSATVRAQDHVSLVTKTMKRPVYCAACHLEMELVKVIDWGAVLYQCPAETNRFYIELSDERGASFLVFMPVGIKDTLLSLPEKQAQWVLGGLLPSLPEPITPIFMERLAASLGETDPPAQAA